MNKIATPQDLQGELREILAYCQTNHPSRVVLASKLSVLADRVSGAQGVASNYDLEGLSPEEYEALKHQLKSAFRFPFTLRYHKSVKAYIGMVQIKPTAAQGHLFTEDQMTQILKWLIQHDYESNSVTLAERLRDPSRFLQDVTVFKKVT